MLAGRTVPLTAAELNCWRHYYLANGFDADRIEGAVALSGAAICQAWGAKVTPHELVPRYGPQPQLHGPALVATLSRLPGAKVRRIPKALKAAPDGR